MQNMGVKKQQWSVEVSIHDMALEPAQAVEKQTGSWLFRQFEPTWHWHQHSSSTGARLRSVEKGQWQGRGAILQVISR